MSTVTKYWSSPIEESPTTSTAGVSLGWLRDLETVGSYGDDWDGQGSVAPAPALVRFAQQLIYQLCAQERMMPPERVVASPRGGLVLEWRHPEGYVEAEIEEPGRVEWMLETLHGEFHHSERFYARPRASPVTQLYSDVSFGVIDAAQQYADSATLSL